MSRTEAQRNVRLGGTQCRSQSERLGGLHRDEEHEIRNDQSPGGTNRR